MKKKKKMKRMMDGGMANAMMQRGTQPNERGPIKGAPDYTTMPIRGPGGRIRGGGGVPVQGPGGVVVPPMRPEGKKTPGQIRDRLMGMMGRAGKGTEYPGMPKKLDLGRGTNIQIGGGGRTPGIRGVSDAPGRINPDYARNRAGIPSITQIESKPISGMRPDPVTGRLPTPVPKVDMTAPRQPGQKGYGMKGGGLARKGVGMALAKGGLVKANGCAQRGKSKGKIV